MARTHLDDALAAFNAARYPQARALLQARLKTAPQDLDALYLMGVTEQADQNPDASLRLYDRVLALQPDHLGAHYNKALLLSSQGQHAEALKHHDTAIRLAPENFWSYVNRGNTLAALKQLDAAIANYDQALAIKPGLPEALANKGNALLELGRPAAALECYEQALRSNPRAASAWIDKGRTLIELARYSEALACSEQALRLAPQDADAWCLRGLALNEIGDHAEALNCCQRAIDLKPDHAEAWANKGVACFGLDQHQDALACQQRAIELKPDTPRAWNNLGVVLSHLNRHDEALASLEQAIKLKPEYADAYVNLGVLLAEMGRDDAAMASLEQANALEPDCATAQWNLSHLLVKHGQYRSAWEKFEYRWHPAVLSLRRFNTQKPLWQGQPTDRPLLLWGEQGIGDQILFGSILPELASLPQRKTVALDRRLITLFRRSLPDFEYIDLEQVSDALDFAEQLPLGSLPRYFRTSEESFRAKPGPYLLADPIRSAALRRQTEQPGKLVCGIAWSSSRKTLGIHKTITLEQMLVTLAFDRFHFVNLQYGDTVAERAALQTMHGIAVQSVDEVDNFHDIDGLAALIQACDVVITTSNSTAHLAGALGKETLLLLPLGKGKLWYWTEVDGKNPWYPSVRSFSQTVPGDWQQPLEQVKRYLEDKSWN